ncbi:MAG: hypothetical protein NXI10_08805 [bacterium]|nr:hypothetical protein [bacterium]
MVSEEGKTRAIIAHITLIGWIIALVQNNEKKDEFASFYIRQVLGLIIIAIGLSFVGLIFGIIPFLGLIIVPAIWIGMIALWIVSLVGAVNGEKKELPILGAQFQEWFKSM